MKQERSNSCELRPRSLGRSWVGLVPMICFVCAWDVFAADSSLADAAEKSDRTIIRTLLKQRADVNAPRFDELEKSPGFADNIEP